MRLGYEVGNVEEAPAPPIQCEHVGLYVLNDLFMASHLVWALVGADEDSVYVNKCGACAPGAPGARMR